VSRTLEEFYTVRCQVADMRNLYESLDEVTVKDTLEGDNMYTCSQCGKKVRAEKRLVIVQEFYIHPLLVLNHLSLVTRIVT
jgi:ubiquitin C-terminal hydrolase